MEATKITRLNVDLTELDECSKKSDFFTFDISGTPTDDTANLYEEFFINNSTREIFDNAVSTKIITQRGSCY